MVAWLPLFFRRPRPAPEHLDVRFQDRVFKVAIRRNRSARRLILRVRSDTGEPVLTLPGRTPLTQARDFLDRHGGWIAARLDRLPAQIGFHDGAEFPLRGRACRIVATGAARGIICLEPGTTDGPDRLLVPGAPEHVARRVTDYLKRAARADLEKAVAHYAARAGVTVQRLSVKDTRSRWGSCSARGALSFSWRLVMAPPRVLDYLAAHEVAHRLEMNHSARFWQHVADLCPHWQEAESWLTRHAASLHRYGSAGHRPTAL